MKARKLRLLITAVVLMGSLQTAAGQTPEIKIIFDQKIPMRDGVRLSGTLWMPENIRDPLPAILVFTPYISDESQKRGMFFSQNGYVYMSVDVRGRGNSEGIFYPLEGDKHSRDIYDIIEWISAQPWSDDRVAMRGGSYRGMVQWQAMKTRHKNLVTIVPTDPPYPGIDFPLYCNIFTPYIARWLAYTSGVTGNINLFYDARYWSGRFLKMYREHLPFSEFWKLAGIDGRIFKRWLAHPSFDEFWQNLSPGPEDYRNIRIPILTITCQYVSDQYGAMRYYRDFMKYAPEEVKKKHYIIIGPWDHAGTRYPKKELMGLTFGDNAVLDMEQLHLQWYDWHLKGKKRPDLLKDRVCYYTTGENQWKYASSLDDITNETQTWYLTSEKGRATDVFRSGGLDRNQPGMEKPDRLTYDPLDTSPAQAYADQDYTDFAYANFLLDETSALSGRSLVYHGPPLTRDLEATGFIQLNAYISLNVPDTDLMVSLHEVRPDGRSILLTYTWLRARYRNSISKAELVKAGEINLYQINSFDLFSRKLGKGSRLRLVISPLNLPETEKNYNSGGTVAQETARDAQVAVIKLYHDPDHPSHLFLPVFNKQGKR